MCMKTGRLVSKGPFPDPRKKGSGAKIVKAWKVMMVFNGKVVSPSGDLTSGRWYKSRCIRDFLFFYSPHAWDWGFHVYTSSKDAVRRWNDTRDTRGYSLFRVEVSGLVGTGLGDGNNQPGSRIRTYRWIRYPKTPGV